MPSSLHSARTRARRPDLLLALLACAALSFTLACRAIGPRVVVEPAPIEASAALEEARSWARSDQPQSRERARAAVLRAIELAPDWVAPRRLFDEMRREDLLGIEALAEHRAALAARPNDAVELYLAGRLEGERAAQRFVRAAELAPELSWSQHGLGWVAAERHDFGLALRHAERACELARDPWERSYFSATIARYLVAADEPRRALAVLERRLAAPELSPVDYVELSVQTALIELTLLFQPEYRRGFERALELLRECDLTDSEIEQLVSRLRLLRSFDGGSLDLQLALASRPGVLRDRLRADLMLEQRPTPLALGLLYRGLRDGGRRPNAGPLLRAARFAAGQFALGVEEWLADLPAAVLDAERRPRDPRLARVVAAAREVTPASGPDVLAQLGDMLLEAGWFSEARSVASVLAVEDLERALRLEEQAAAGQALLADMRRTLQALDQDELGPAAVRDAGSSSRSTRRVGDLSDMLGEFGPLVARAQRLLGGEHDEARVRAALEQSPRIEYGGIGAILHPGPTFSAADESARLGVAGEPVPGLASVLDRLGRFAVFGQVLGGGGPDGTILQRVLVEPRRGEHLGVEWSGTIAWCEGTDLKSRAGRLGADISGAALHEGYWVDIDSLRRERDPWAIAAREFASEASRERMQRALASRGLALVTPPARRDQRRFERCDATTLLGSADRLRLAVLRDRARAGAAGSVELDELLEVTAIHEEGHLCDRARFWPLSQHLGRALAFLIGSGLTPTGVAQRLEYRAQLVALCEARDSRVPLVSVLGAAENSRSGLTPHAAAYRSLLADVLAELDRALERDPGAWPEIDPDFVLAHQLHFLRPEQVRELARAVARREGLFEG